MKMGTKNPGGYITLIFILILTIAAVLWMLYLWKKQWVGGISGTNIEVPEVQNNSGDKNAPQQLDELRSQLKNITDKKDQEIEKELK
jgi:hypothetical protein